MTTREKYQYKRVYREFIEHLTNNKDPITETFFLERDTPFDIKSWAKFLNKVKARYGADVVTLGSLGKFSIQPLGEDYFLIFDPVVSKMGGKKKSRRSVKRKKKVTKGRSRRRTVNSKKVKRAK